MTPFLPIAAAILTLQGSASNVPPTHSPATTAVAQRAMTPPVIDGKDNDEVWRQAQVITTFRQFRPVEDADPTLRTEARVAYDDRNFYAFVRAFDPHPDSILKLLARRDIRVCCDQIKIVIDSYHDRRTGYEFAVSPAGVKRDYAIYDDNNEDETWDGVWEVATQVDSVGWTAEFRIPLSQLRYAHQASNVFGFAVWRDIDRHHLERVSWPLYRVSQVGFVSQLGDVVGLDGLPAPTRLEIAPYAVTKNVPRGFIHEQQLTAGADVKYGITSNITVDATVNPDFGQVEADPSVLNLSAFETFFQERRPFFVEGTGIFQFGVNCSVVNCYGEGLFYSRRVGRSPQLRGQYGDANSPTASNIAGAAKVTGRLPSGLSIGALDAVTQRQLGDSSRTIEPLTNYAAIRAQQDFRKGESGIGIMATAVDRNSDQWTENFLNKSAYAGALNFRHRFHNGRYQLSGSFDLSNVSGTPAAISRIQQSSVHYYQRPDDNRFDSTRTSLAGDAEELLFRRTSGFIQFETSYERRSPGFEINDLGFLLYANQQSFNNWASLNWLRPFLIFQQGFWNFNWWQYWTADGLPTERAANTNAHMQLKNGWYVHMGGTVGQLGDVFDDRKARGGPAVRVSRYFAPWGGFGGDSRKPIVPYLFVNLFRGDAGNSSRVSASPEIDMRVASQFIGSVVLNLSHSISDAQYVGTQTDSSGTHYAFAHLDQKTTSLSFRLDYTASTTLTLQAYASPFVSKGHYSNVRQVVNPRAEQYDSRYAPYSGITPGDFNFKQFNSNLVLRWEYRPGSTLFVVWSQGRDDFEPTMGTRSVRGDFGRLFNAYPRNTFLVKMSYWLSR